MTCLTRKRTSGIQHKYMHVKICMCIRHTLYIYIKNTCIYPKINVIYISKYLYTWKITHMCMCMLAIGSMRFVLLVYNDYPIRSEYEWRCISCLNHYIYARYTYKHDRRIYCHIDVTRVSDLMSYVQDFARQECAAVTCVLVTELPFETQCVLQCILHTRNVAWKYMCLRLQKWEIRVPSGHNL